VHVVFQGVIPCAEAIAEGRASYDACVVGGKEVEEKIRKIMEEAKSQS